MTLTEELARRAAFVVDQAQMYALTQHQNAELEARVLQRTAQLQAANTELENSRRQLLRLADHEQTAREEERTRLAREILGELGQDLTALEMDLAWLRRHTDPQRIDLLQKLQGMSDRVDITIRGMRRIVTNLRATLLDDQGLLAAIERQLQEFGKHTAINCTLKSRLKVVALDAGDTNTLFRIFQETLTNVARHAAATQVMVVVDEAQGYVRLWVQDNGHGFSERQVDGSKSFGLLGMRERVKSRSGDFYIHAAPGRGTLVVAQLPVLRLRPDQKP